MVSLVQHACKQRLRTEDAAKHTLFHAIFTGLRASTCTQTTYVGQKRQLALPCELCCMHQDSTAGYACGITSASAALLVKASAVLPSSRDFSAVLEDVSLGGTGEVDAAGVAGACLSTSADTVSGD